MEQSLKFVLGIFAVYAISGIFPIYCVYKSTTRIERISMGLWLIFFSAFVLTELTLVTGVADNLFGSNTISIAQRAQLSNFMQYIIFGSVLCSLLYGSVGANVFTTAIINEDSSRLIEILHRIDKKLDETDQKIEKLKRTRNWHLIFIIPWCVIGLVILASLWK